MRLATYNVQSGGFESYHDYETKEPPRLGHIQDAVATIDADVIGLTDTFRWTERSPADLKAIFGYDYSASIPINDPTMDKAGKNIGLTVLSRRELVTVGEVSLGENDRNALEVGIELDDQQILAIITGYFHHSHEKRRVGEAKALARHAKAKGGGELKNVVAVGDLNTTSPHNTKAQAIKFGMRYTGLGRAQGLPQELYGVLQGNAWRVLNEAGFVDPNKKPVQNTWPTPRKFGGFTISAILNPDYILHSSDLQATNTTVLKGDVFNAASDHFPLQTELAK